MPVYLEAENVGIHPVGAQPWWISQRRLSGQTRLVPV